MDRRPDDATKSRYQELLAGVRSRYERSFAQDVMSGLGAVDFGDRIIVFGACMLLSVMPLVIVLSALASHRIQDDIARHRPSPAGWWDFECDARCVQPASAG
jgi:hypothetical protein